jgi:four helix bundle protein
MEGVHRFQDLVAWQLAIQLKQVVHAYCERPAIERDFKFREQLVDAAASAPRNIAEGFGRVYHPEFARFAIIAKASEHEVLNHLIDAHQRRYITDAELDRGDQAARKALKVLNGLIAYLEATADWGRK